MHPSASEPVAPPDQKSLRIGIAVHGRFHAFDLARELTRRGHSLVLCTNYSRAEAARFGIPPECIRSNFLHKVLSALVNRLPRHQWRERFEPALHIAFSKWASRKLRPLDLDVIYAFSGVSENIFKPLAGVFPPLKITARGSSHIRTQHALLEEEEKRAGTFIEKPSPWRISREEREYEISDAVMVLSSFAKKSFEEQGCRKARLMISGNDVSTFRPDLPVIERRSARIRSGDPLQVLMVGSFLYRKGIIDFIEIASQLGTAGFQFTFVGDIPPECGKIADSASRVIRFVPRQPHFSLPGIYAEADLFIFTTIEDGYPAVLGQAHAAGLPILATPNSSAPDIVDEDETGWILPIRSPESFVQRLRHCASHRAELATMVHRIYEANQQRDFEQVAADFLKICADELHPDMAPAPMTSFPG